MKISGTKKTVLHSLKKGALLCLIAARLIAGSGSSYASEQLPSITDIIHTLDKERGVGGDIYSMSTLLESYYFVNRSRLREAGYFDHVGQSVKWSDSDLYEFALSDIGITGAIWLEGEIAVRDYLAFRRAQNWVGPVTGFPARSALTFRKVEAALILFQHVLINLPSGFITLKPVESSPNSALLKTAILDFRQEWRDRSIDRSHLWIGYIDLDRDGSDEAIVDLEHFDYCGSTGCHLSIYSKTGDVWRKIGAMKGNKYVVVYENGGTYGGLFSGQFFLRWSASGDTYALDCVEWRCRDLNPHINVH